MTDVAGQDLKADGTTHRLKILCGEPQKTDSDFKIALATHVPDTSVHEELASDVFLETADDGGVCHPQALHRANE